MAASKNKEKKVIQRNIPKGNTITQKENPEAYYSKNPSWRFLTCDKEKWSLMKNPVMESFWEEILPFLQNLESQTWADILIHAKKQNHSIIVEKLNRGAIERLTELCIEAESIISLRIKGTHRIYGFISDSAFNILWIDFNHGDNYSCVCRSIKKHT